MKLFFDPKDDMSAHRDIIYSIVKYINPKVVLEIGIRGGKSTTAIMNGMQNTDGAYYGCDKNLVRLPYYHKSKLFTMTSDELAKEWTLPIDFLFIDGDHHYEQVKRDYLNFSKFVTLNGFMLFHDTYPPDDSYKDENKCGSAYKILDDLKNDSRFESITLPYSFGLTICRRVK